MVNVIKIDQALADGVYSEVYAPTKPVWSYYSITTDFYDLVDAKAKQAMDKLNSLYGPVIDTQRFTYSIFGKKHPLGPRGFAQFRNDLNSYYRKKFTFIPALIDHLQEKYIPTTHYVERVMVNMQTIRPQWSLNAIHPDSGEPESITILYYVNDSDGDTFFFNREECIARVQPVKGTAAIYPSTTWHAGSTPVKNETRSVINLVFAKK